MYRRVDPNVILSKSREMTRNEQIEMDIILEYIDMCRELNKPILSNKIQDMKAQLEEYKKRL